MYIFNQIYCSCSYKKYLKLINICITFESDLTGTIQMNVLFSGDTIISVDIDIIIIISTHFR